MIILFVPFFFIYIGYPMATGFAAISGLSMIGKRNAVAIPTCALSLFLGYTAWDTFYSTPGGTGPFSEFVFRFGEASFVLFTLATAVLMALLFAITRHWKTTEGHYGPFGNFARIGIAFFVLAFLSYLSIWNREFGSP